jgi:nitrogen regulatory protein P-II 1
MKKIEAIIRSSHFAQVKESLHKAGIDFFTFEDVKGFGNQKTEKTMYRGHEYDLGSIARTKLTIVAPDPEVEGIVYTILTSAKTGQIGDGKIFISPVEEIIRIRSGERNEAAL